MDANERMKLPIESLERPALDMIWYEKAEPLIYFFIEGGKSGESSSKRKCSLGLTKL